MADLVRMLLLTADEAALVRGTGHLGHSLEPRTILGGPYTNKAALPLAVLTDQEHIGSRLFLMQCAQANINVEEAWPPEEGP